jgi:hypothetical protein
MENVENKFYGIRNIDITGPTVLGEAFNKAYPDNNIPGTQGTQGTQGTSKKVVTGIFEKLEDNYYFTFDEGVKIQHKCDLCNKTGDWVNGNDYGILWFNEEVYSE